MSFVFLLSKAHKLSKLAFQAFIRSYITRSKQEKKVFAIKKVHLGHLAKSFGLREPPSQLTEKIFKTKKGGRPRRPDKVASRFADKFRGPRSEQSQAPRKKTSGWVGSETVMLPKGMEHRKNSTPRARKE